MLDVKILRKYIVATLVVLILCPVNEALAQRWKLRRYEFGGGVGTTQIFGDIGGTADSENLYGLKDIKFDETKLAFNVHLRYKLDPVYSIKTSLFLGFGSGSDEDSRNDRGRSYKTTLIEFSTQGEYYFIGEEKKYRSAAMFNKRGMINNYRGLAAYGFVGVGLIYYSPKFSGPLKPADVVTGYSKVSGAFPFGVGAKYIINDRVLLNAELGYRYALTDFLDGHTQKFNSKHNDVYYFLMFNVSYRLNTTRRGLPAFLDKGYRRARSGRSIL